MDKELILIIDFYGQYNQLIARRVRECNVYSEIVPFSTSIEKIKQKNPKGIIFTGGPASVYAENAPKCSKEIFNLGKLYRRRENGRTAEKSGHEPAFTGAP